LNIKGIEVHSVSNSGRTPLDAATSHGHTDVVKALLETQVKRSDV